MRARRNVDCAVKQVLQMFHTKLFTNDMKIDNYTIDVR